MDLKISECLCKKGLMEMNLKTQKTGTDEVPEQTEERNPKRSICTM
jgi:hypothetical protein